MRLRLDRDTLTSPLTLLGLTAVAFGSMALVVATESGDAEASAPVVLPAAPVTTTTTTAVVSPDAPVTVPAPPTTLDVTPPSLAVAPGIDGSTVPGADLTLTGTSEPGTRVAVGFATTVTEPTGDWWLAVSLAEGDNTLAVSATDELGNQSLVSVRVTYLPPVPITAVPTTLPTPTTAAPPPPATNRPRPTPTPTPTAPPATAPTPTAPPATAPPATAPPTQPTIPVDVETGQD